MKTLTIVISIFILMFMVYSTNVFKAYFMSDKYYESIFEGSFDPSIKGASVKINLKNKYDAEYSLFIIVPEHLSVELRTEKEVLRYKFVSNGKTLKEGLTDCPFGAMGYSSSNDNYCSALLLNFTLPYPGAAEGVVLELQAENPMSSLKKYEGEIMLSIMPASLK
ncbi:hypothetical protein [Maridesulfovibrio frigidus]|uniref:hypothetical protein n=1 Tax=Maridesulfovibrio frigidus TaxID=340956 RepID=UPI0004E0EF01|nr:hypothetical protein [Maridesulfovibrio frigidus]